MTEEWIVLGVLACIAIGSLVVACARFMAGRQGSVEAGGRKPGVKDQS